MWEVRGDGGEGSLELGGRGCRCSGRQGVSVDGGRAGG